jgi:hypothetical protein
MVAQISPRLTVDEGYGLRTRLTVEDVLEILQRWQTASLGFGYFRSGGGVLQTGTASLLRVSPSSLTLDTGDSRLALLLDKARFEYGNLGFLKPDFRATYDIEGLSVFLGNKDWVCLFPTSGNVDVNALFDELGSLPRPP